MLKYKILGSSDKVDKIYASSKVVVPFFAPHDICGVDVPHT